MKESQNGKSIGLVNGTELFNASNRFRDPYTNKYEGWMFVTDIGFWVYKKDLQLAFAAGVASGDDNPNFETIDGNYTGFIGLQEIYSGNRVKSAFLMGGAGKLKRPLSIPSTNQAPSRFATNISGFTDLIFAGVGLNWKPEGREKKISIHPNVIAYWEEQPSPKFDALTKKDLKEKASTFLGAEADVFFKYNLLKDLQLFFVASAFFPGTHYRDIQGKPLTSDQDKALDALDQTGFSKDQLPNLGHDIAYTFNAGLEFKF